MADAPGDMEAGRAALERGEFDAALPLLRSAVEGLPQSVDAHLLLAECLAKMGDLQRALAEYQAILRISPDHQLAKKVVEALTGRMATAEAQLAVARQLMDVSAYAEAEALLARLVADPIGADQRNAARLLLIESRLWGQSRMSVVSEASQLIRRSGDPAIEGPARVIEALELLTRGEPRYAEAEELLAGAEQLAQPWESHSRLARLLIELRDPTRAAAVSSGLSELLGQVPAGSFRTALLQSLAGRLLTYAELQLGRGDIATVLSVVWPMVSGAALPDADAVMKPVDLAGGWLPDEQPLSQFRRQVSRLLAATAIAEQERFGEQARLLGIWLAAEVSRQTKDAQVGSSERLILAGRLSSLGRPPLDRRPGSVLTIADQIQRELLMQLAARVSEEAQRGQVVDLVLAQLERYRGAGDHLAGLEQFVTVEEEREDENDQPRLRARLSGELEKLPAGAARLKLLVSLAQSYAALGKEEFEKAAAGLAPQANQVLHRFDRIALDLAGQAGALQLALNTDQGALAVADGVVERYASSQRWDAAQQALALYYRQQPAAAGVWQPIHLKIRQATSEEDQALAAQRQLGGELHPRIKEALAEAVALLESNPAPDRQQSVTNLATPLIHRYAGLSRVDLAETVIEQVGAASDGKLLADWALWVRANLHESQAGRALMLATNQHDGGENLALDKHHEIELQLISQLLREHPDSKYRSQAVERVLQISATYQNYRSFATATSVLKDFVQAHSDLTPAERVEYQIVQVALELARIRFDERVDKVHPPQQISAEYDAAITAIAEFLQAHPTGPFSGSAENQLIEIAQTYGKAGAWSISRQVLARFGEAVPDYRSPGYLRFLTAVTYLGQLDTEYAIGLLAPAPPQTQPAVMLGGIALADAGLPQSSMGGVAGDPFGGQGLPGAGGFGGGGAGSRLPNVIDGPYAAGAPSARPPSAQLPAGEPMQGMMDASRPSETALAMIRQSQQRQFQQLAMMEQEPANAPGQQAAQPQAQQSQGQPVVALPTGSVLSDAELKRQDEAADRAYEILIELIKTTPPADAGLVQQARNQVMWLFGFFEGQLRADRAVVLIRRFLADRPEDPAKIALAFQAINDRLVWAAQRQASERVNLAWLDARHELFEEARRETQAFITGYGDKREWVNRARLLIVDSYDREASMAAAVSSVRAGGLLVQSAEALIDLLREMPDHPEGGGFPNRLWSIADRLQNLAQQDPAIYVLSQIPIHFPIEALAEQSVMRIAELYTVNLTNPLKAVETYQEFLSLNGDNEAIRSQIFSIAQQLAQQQRYLESLHVFGVFVDSFPTDARAPEALRAIGQTHQSNEAWKEAIDAYQRILDEYPNVEVTPQVKLAVAECRINLSEWREARRLYEDFIQQYPQHEQLQVAQSRLTVLKNLDRFENLIADQQVQRNKDDARFQIARIVLEQLQNQVKAIAEFRKVVKEYPQSDLADDAQIEIGRALLALNRADEAREALLQVPLKYPNSPNADDALYLIGQSYEQQAQRLATVTVETARAEAFVRNQRGAYQLFSEQTAQQDLAIQQRRDALKKAGKSAELALDEASNAFRFNGANFGNISNTVRQAEILAETDTALQIANRQDRINEAYREAVAIYARAAAEYPLGDRTDDSLLRMAQIFETELKDRHAAMETYQSIVKLFPGTPVAEDAAWKVAQFYEQEGQFTAASDAYREFIRNYPGSARVADAQFALAEVLEQLGKWVDAMDAYETFRQKFSDHPKARIAQDQINWIKTYRK